jgi:RND family efflux transporter MFP subunit
MNDFAQRWGRPAALAATLALSVAAGGCRQSAAKTAPTPDPVVYFSSPTSREVTDYEDFSGRTEAIKTVEVRARVTGYLERFKFEEGLDVKENDVLFEIDARPYKAILDQAVAEVAQAQAHLAKADADFQRARGTYVREAISKSEYDIAQAAFNESRASIGIAEAKRDTAKLNYEWTKVTAPIAGQVSRRMVDPGNLVQADVTPLTTIVAIDKMYINFDVDERTLLRLRRLVTEGKIQARDQRQLLVKAALADEDRQNFPHAGYVDFSDNRVDPGTGTLRLRGMFENPPLKTAAPGKFVRRMMSPGLFARIRLPIGEPHQALLVPEGAIGNDQGQKYLFLINAENVAYRQNIEVNALHEGLREVKAGILKPTDRVVVSGLQRVRDNLKVDPKPYSSLKKTAVATTQPSTPGPKPPGALP